MAKWREQVKSQINNECITHQIIADFVCVVVGKKNNSIPLRLKPLTLTLPNLVRCYTFNIHF